MAKLLFIEGSFGAGKSTLTRRLSEKFSFLKHYKDGDLNPLDLQWMSVFTTRDFSLLLDHFKEYKELLLKNRLQVGNYVVIAYTKLGFFPGQNGLMDELPKHEIFNNQTTDLEYREIVFEVASNFVKDNNESDRVFLFDSSFLQAHVQEWYFSRGKSEEETISFLMELWKILSPLSPSILYLDVDIKESTNKVKEERRSNNGEGNDWIDEVINYMEHTEYGINSSKKGYELVLNVLEARKEVEKHFLQKKEVQSFSTSNMDYEERFNEIVQLFLSSPWISK